MLDEMLWVGALGWLALGDQDALALPIRVGLNSPHGERRISELRIGSSPFVPNPFPLIPVPRIEPSHEVRVRCRCNTVGVERER